MSATLTLDHHELLWFLDGAIHGSHARWGVFERFVNEVWKQLSEGERESIYTYTKRNHADLFKSEYDKPQATRLAKMLARFNPSNQYRVFVKGRPSDWEREIWETLKGRRPYFDCFLWEGEYYINWLYRVPAEKIKQVKKLPYRTCTDDRCPVRTTCKRFLEHQKGEEVLGDNWGRKCELFIEEGGVV